MKNSNIKLINRKKQQIFPPDLNYKYFENCHLHPFEADAEDFSLVNAWWLAESAFLAYAPEDFIRDQLKKTGISLFRFFNTERCKCFVAATPEYAIITFRGTAIDSFDFFIDWLDNLNIKLVDFNSEGMVHSGFYNAFKDIQEKETGFFDYLLNLKKEYKGIHFWFTGHSLGGAVATIAAKVFRECHSLYTFGSPKVGNSDFCDSLNFPIYRIVHNYDMVTLLPLGIDGRAKNNYKHAGKIKFINKNEALLDEIKFPEIPFTKTIKSSSRIIDIIFDKKKNLFLKIYDVNIPENLNKKRKSPITLFSKMLNGSRKFLLLNRGISIRNHFPVFYAVHIWNIYMKSDH